MIRSITIFQNKFDQQITSGWPQTQPHQGNYLQVGSNSFSSYLNFDQRSWVIDGRGSRVGKKGTLLDGVRLLI